MRRRRQLFIRAHPRPPVCAYVRTCAHTCAHAVFPLLERRRGNRLARAGWTIASPRVTGMEGKRVPLLLSPIVLLLPFPLLPFASLAAPLPVPLHAPPSRFPLRSLRSFALRAPAFRPGHAPQFFFASAFAWICALCIGAVFFSAFFAKVCRFPADNAGMDISYIYPLPERTERALRVFAALDANGASLAVTDLCDGYDVLLLTQELIEAAERLLSESTL